MNNHGPINSSDQFREIAKVVFADKSDEQISHMAGLDSKVVATLRESVGIPEPAHPEACVTNIPNFSNRVCHKLSAISPLVLYVFDMTKEQYVFVSENSHKATGFHPNEITELSREGMEKLVVRADVPQIYRHRRKMQSAKDGQVHELECRVIDSQGRLRWIRSRELVFERDQQGLPTLILGMAEDFSQSKMMEVQIEELLLYAQEGNVHLEVEKEILETEKRSLAKLTASDPLTGVLNRRGFEEQIQSSLNEAEKSGTPFCIVMIDIDNFKNYNDAFGHQAGDLALTSIANVLKSALRDTDYVARFGGEEFVIILNSTVLLEGLAVADRLRTKIEKLDGLHEKVTASFGVSAWRNDDSTIENIIDEADAALYKAKENGRNRSMPFFPAA